jgi:hypothetical protein
MAGLAPLASERAERSKCMRFIVEPSKIGTRARAMGRQGQAAIAVDHCCGDGVGRAPATILIDIVVATLDFTPLDCAHRLPSTQQRALAGSRTERTSNRAGQLVRVWRGGGMAHGLAQASTTAEPG